MPGAINFLVRATMIYKRIARSGKFKSIESLSDLITQVTSIKNYILISYKPSTYSNFLTFKHMFCNLGKFGKAVSWPSLPDRATKKKENCRSLGHLNSIIELPTSQAVDDVNIVQNNKMDNFRSSVQNGLVPPLHAIQ